MKKLEYGLKDLFKAMIKAHRFRGSNFDSFQNMIRRLERKGDLSFYRNDMDWRVLTKEEINEIVSVTPMKGHPIWHSKRKGVERRKLFSSLVKDKL